MKSYSKPVLLDSLLVLSGGNPLLPDDGESGFTGGSTGLAGDEPAPDPGESGGGGGDDGPD